MYIIDKDNNRIKSIEQKTFSELGFKERAHLQEWIAYNPQSLGEDLLIIQKEFDGFDDTRERLDLLALDKWGNIVVIENKLDDTGRDVTWQSLKYASYCSSLTKHQIKEIYQEYLDKENNGEKAEDNLINFFDEIDYEELEINVGQTQRIIMVAGSFRKEVTSTVLWLMNYKLRIQCIKATPYQLGDQFFLDLRQIIPVKEAEEFTIKLAEKNEEESNVKTELKSRHNLRIYYWNELLSKASKIESFSLFNNISPSKDNWIGASAGISGVAYNFVVSRKHVRVELYISNKSTETNKLIFDKLIDKKEQIEQNFGHEIIWQRLDDKKACRVKCEMTNVNIFNRDDWDIISDFLIDRMVKFEKVLKGPLKEIKENW